MVLRCLSIQSVRVKLVLFEQPCHLQERHAQREDILEEFVDVRGILDDSWRGVQRCHCYHIVSEHRICVQEPHIRSWILLSLDTCSEICNLGSISLIQISFNATLLSFLRILDHQDIAWLDIVMRDLKNSAERKHVNDLLPEHKVLSASERLVRHFPVRDDLRKSFVCLLHNDDDICVLSTLIKMLFCVLVF
jgi:hypothetical protein